MQDKTQIHKKRARRANLGAGGQRLSLKLLGELEQNEGKLLAFLWTSNWYEWYASEGPGVEFKVHFRALHIQLPKVKELLYRITEQILHSIIYFQCLSTKKVRFFF